MQAKKMKKGPHCTVPQRKELRRLESKLKDPKKTLTRKQVGKIRSLRAKCK